MLKIMKQNLEDLTSPNLWRAVAAEMVGTIFLVFLGCGAHTLQNGQPTAIGNGSVVTTAEPSVVQISLTFGLVVGTMIWCIAHISGGHINPAVTVAALITRRVSVVRAFFYIVAQIVGAIIGAAILIGLTPESQQKTIGLNSLRGDVTDAQGFGVELMITFVVVLTVLASLDEKRTDLHGSAPLTIGLAVALGHLFAVSLVYFISVKYKSGFQIIQSASSLFSLILEAAYYDNLLTKKNPYTLTCKRYNHTSKSITKEDLV